jgi:hypothetical protein
MSLTARFAPFCLAALGLTLVAPLWLLLLSPLLLGVPHIAADLRYLAFSRGRLVVGWPVWLPLALLTAARSSVVLGGPGSPALEVMLGACAVVGGVAGADASPRRRAAFALAGTLAALGLLRPELVALTLGHVHNWLALGLWLAWARASASSVVSVALLLAACGLALEPGLAPRAGSVAPVPGLDLASLTEALAPGLEAGVALRLVMLFAFAQALHYAVWLALLPAAARPSVRYAASWRESLGPVVAGAAVVISAAVLLAGLLAPAETRSVYLSLVVFHGWLELAVIARWMAAPGSAPWAP